MNHYQNNFVNYLLTRIYTENHDTSPWPAVISNTVFLSSGCTWKTRVVPEKNSNIDRESLRFIKLVLNSFLECKCPRPHIPFVKLFCLVFIVSIYVSFFQSQFWWAVMRIRWNANQIYYRVILYWVKFSQSQRNKNSGFNPLVSDQMAMMDALKGKHP